MATKTWIDAHHQDQIDQIEDGLNRRNRCPGVDCDARFFAKAADEAKLAMHMRPGLDVKGDEICARCRKGGDKMIDRADHQMDVEGL